MSQEEIRPERINALPVLTEGEIRERLEGYNPSIMERVVELFAGKRFSHPLVIARELLTVNMSSNPTDMSDPESMLAFVETQSMAKALYGEEVGDSIYKLIVG